MLEIIDEPTASVECILINGGGRTGTLFTSPHRRFERITGEFNSHLAVHSGRIVSSGGSFHALVHAQPRGIHLSRVPRNQDKSYLTTHLLHRQPGTISNVPEGIGFVPFTIPGSPELTPAHVSGFSVQVG